MPFLAMMLDIHRHDVPYEFDAETFFGDHVGLALRERRPENDDEVGASVRAAIMATNCLARGGASGYLALIDLLMVSFREDYRHADEMVRRHILRRPAADDAGR